MAPGTTSTGTMLFSWKSVGFETVNSTDLPKNQKGKQGMTRAHSCNSVDNLLLMVDLRKKVLTFRDIIDLPPCDENGPIDELFMGTIADLHQLYPKVVQRIPMSEMEEMSICKILEQFYNALIAIGDSWAQNHKWMKIFKCEKERDVKELSLEQSGERVLEILDYMIEVAREMFDVMEEEDKKNECSRNCMFGDHLNESYSDNKASFCLSPVTPTSVIPELSQNFADFSYSPPLLWPLRLQAVGKLKPIDVKRLSFHMFPNVTASNFIPEKENKVDKVEPEIKAKSNSEASVVTKSKGSPTDSKATERTLKVQKTNSNGIACNKSDGRNSGTFPKLKVKPPPTAPRKGGLTALLQPPSPPVNVSATPTPAAPKKPKNVSAALPPKLPTLPPNVSESPPRLLSMLSREVSAVALQPSPMLPPKAHAVPPPPPPLPPPPMVSQKSSTPPLPPPPTLPTNASHAPPPTPPTLPQKEPSAPNPPPPMVLSKSYPAPPTPPVLQSKALVPSPPSPLSPAVKPSNAFVAPPPPPPPPMKSTNGSMDPPSPLPPPMSSANGSAAALPPPPPPPMSSANGSAAAPPPPPMPISGGSVPLPPPPMSLTKGGGAGGPPPPPPLASKALRPKKANTKLKRSSHMGNLYRVLKGKVEGTGQDNKSNGKKGVGGGAGGSKQSMADALAEMTKRSAYFQQIEEDVQKYAKTIMEIKVAINSFQTKDMSELLKFHQHVEHQLEKLTDETQVLSRFEDFPQKKLETLRTAATLYLKLKSVMTNLVSWKIETPLGKLLEKVEGYFNKIKGDLDTLERTKDEELKRFQSYKIDFDFSILLRIKEAVVDLSSTCMEVALKEMRESKAAATNGQSGPKAENQKKACTKMLWRAFQLAFRVYTFAGGQDDRADMLSKELAQEIETNPQH